MARIDETAPHPVSSLSLCANFDLQFSHFLIRDDEPLLFHTGMRRMFPEVREAVAQLIDPAALRWISWSHFVTLNSQEHVKVGAKGPLGAGIWELGVVDTGELGG